MTLHDRLEFMRVNWPKFFIVWLDDGQPWTLFEACYVSPGYFATLTMPGHEAQMNRFEYRSHILGRPHIAGTSNDAILAMRSLRHRTVAQ